MRVLIGVLLMLVLTGCHSMMGIPYAPDPRHQRRVAKPVEKLHVDVDKSKYDSLQMGHGLTQKHKTDRYRINPNVAGDIDEEALLIPPGLTIKPL